MDHVAEMQRSITSARVETLVSERIGDDIDFYERRLPREVVVMWNGYLQSLAEWSPAATSAMIARLRSMLPEIADEPRRDDTVKYPTDAQTIEARKRVRIDAVASDVSRRIAADRARFGRELPREIAVSWSGYIQALGEWCPGSRSIIRPLRDMLPAIPHDPSSADNGQYLRV